MLPNLARHACIIAFQWLFLSNRALFALSIAGGTGVSSRQTIAAKGLAGFVLTGSYGTSFALVLGGLILILSLTTSFTGLFSGGERIVCSQIAVAAITVTCPSIFRIKSSVGTCNTLYRGRITYIASTTSTPYNRFGKYRFVGCNV